MAGLGTIVNVAGILAGCGVGLLLKGGLPKRLQDTISSAVGLCVVFVGITGALKGLMTINGGSFETQDTLVSVVCMVAGAALGEWINIEYKLQQLGEWCKSRIPAGQVSGTFVEAFVSSSLLFCVGAMAIVGSIQDGLTGNATTLYTKAVIDGIVVMVMASVYGKGVLFAALPVGVLQGAITACAGLLAPVFSQPVIDNLSFLGSILIFCVGVNLAFGTKFKVANMLPALVFGVVFTLVVPYLPL